MAARAALGRAMLASGGTILGLGAATMVVSSVSMGIAKVVITQNKKKTAVACGVCHGNKRVKCDICGGEKAIRYHPFKTMPQQTMPLTACAMCSATGEQTCLNCLGEGYVSPGIAAGKRVGRAASSSSGVGSSRSAQGHKSSSQQNSSRAGSRYAVLLQEPAEPPGGAAGSSLSGSSMQEAAAADTTVASVAPVEQAMDVPHAVVADARPDPEVADPAPAVMPLAATSAPDAASEATAAAAAPAEPLQATGPLLLQPAATAAAAAVTATYDVIVVGAGLAGLKAAVDLKNSGFNVAVLEGRDRIGGRVFSAKLGRSTTSIEVGAQWFHGTSSTASSPLMCVRNIATGSLGITPVSTGSSNIVRLNSSASVIDDTPYWNAYKTFSTWANGQTWPDTASLQTAITTYQSSRTLSAADKQGIAYGVNSDVEQEFGASAAWLSMNYYDEGLALGGGDSIMPLGKNLSQIPAFLAASLPSGSIKLSHNVTNIAYNSTTGVTVTAVSGGVTYTFAAKAAVVTIPLGVLQRRGAGLFSPALPASKQNAISRLGMGLLNKVILEFPASYASSGPFAAGSSEAGAWWMNRLPLATGDSGNWQEFFNINRALKVPVMVAFQAGQPAVTAENTMNNNATVASLMTQLRTWYGASMPDPINSYVTRWWNDPWSFGSYSYQTPTCTGSERNAFATAEPSGSGKTARLWFAGEHTHLDYPATMQGAFLSGQSAAAAIKGKFTPAGR